MNKEYLAQIVNINGQQIKGPLIGINDIGQLMSKVILFLIPLGGVILFLILIWGGYDFLISRGNPEKIKSARAKITTGLIGFFLLIVSYLIVRLISQVFGLGGQLFP